MQFYPLIIPFPANKGPMHLSHTITYLAMAGGMYWYYNKKIKPSAELEIKYNKCDNTQINVYTKEDHFPSKLNTAILNKECLINKGYIVKEPNVKYAYNKTHLYSIRHKDDAPISTEEFLADCKECDVKTKIEYKYKTIFDKTKHVKNEVSWQDAFKERHS
jgi:hypothetical protein